MGKRLVRALICYICYLDTQLAFEKAAVRFSPMVVLELEYLYEINGTILTPNPFPIIAEIAIGETWTRDPFDRLIVSHAKANGRAGLVAKDELIARHYPNTIW